MAGLHAGTSLGELLTAFADGRDVAADAARLLTEIQSALAKTGDDGIRRELGDYATECRYVVSGGTGPTVCEAPHPRPIS